MRAIGYYRLTNGQGSLEELEAAFMDYCDRYLHQPVKLFWEKPEGEGEASSEYQSMLEYIRGSGSNFLVVVPDAGHLGGDLEAVARSMVDLESTGSKVICDDDEMPDPIQNAFQVLGVKGVSRTRSERIKESMRERALKGQGLGKPPYGYRNGAEGALEVVPDEAAVVELIYRLYTKDGLGLRLIAQHLNERGIPTRRGGKWNMVTIRDILRNPTYMGTYTRFGLRLPKSHEAIIPPKVFRAAQDETKSRRPTGRVVNAEPFLLSGLAYCGACGNKMMGVTRRQTWKRKDGRRAKGVYRYYQCQSRNNLSTCEYHTWRAPLLEGMVLSQLKYALEAKAASQDGAAEQSVSDTRRMWEARVKNAERRFVQAMRRTARGEMSVKILGEYLKELDAVRRGAENAEHPAAVDETLAKWESLSFAERQGFLMAHIVRIDVNDQAVDVIV